MILVATGGVDHDHVVALAKKYFTRSDKYIGPGTPTFERDVPKLDNDVYADFWKTTEFQSCEIRQSYNQGKLILFREQQDSTSKALKYYLFRPKYSIWKYCIPNIWLESF